MNNTPDRILVSMMETLNYVNKKSENTITIGITLFVNGQIITGNIIDFNEYLKIQEELCKNSNNQCRMLVGKEFFKNTEKHMYKEDFEFIHLTNVKIINANGSKQILKTPIRIRSSSITGFAFDMFE